jgi:serine/threonine-protein kinase
MAGEESVSSIIGQTLGQYQIIELLGTGGMATVYKGKQLSIDRFVAIKVLPPHPGLDEQFKERFQLEARAIGSLQNPNILPLYDYGTQDDLVYLVMAYVEGGTLENLMSYGLIDIREVEKIVRAIASALDYAHRHGIVHRDIKPANILMSDGHPLLADFGVVKMVASSSDLTAGAIVGTPRYMAPEQGQGLEVDRRADVYALGVIIFEMLTGRQPFVGDTPMQTIMRHISDPVPDARTLRPELSAEVADVLVKAMAKTPDQRYQSAGELAEALSSALHKNRDALAEIQKQYPIGDQNQVEQTIRLPESTQPQPQPQTVIIRERTNPILLLGVIGIFAILIVVIATMLVNNQNPSRPPVEQAVVRTQPPPTPTVAVVAAAVPTFGEVRYSSANQPGDTINVRLSGVRKPASGSEYAAWLLNSESGETLFLGRVIVDSLGEGSISFTDSEARSLPSLFNTVLISIETDPGATPSADVPYQAQVPLAVTAAIREIFVTSADGLDGDGSLLAGLYAEASFALQHAGLAARATNLGGIQSHSEHTINIVRGETVDYNGNGSGENPGRDIGVYFFLSTIEETLQEITDQPDASINLQVNAEFIRVCTQNVRQWADEVSTLEQTMLASASVEDAADEAALSTDLMNHMVNGFDLNQNGSIEPFEGECGIAQIAEYGLQFARMDILEAAQ